MEQLELILDEDALGQFVQASAEIEAQMDELRESQRTLRTLYQDRLPLRAVQTALKVTRARLKLEAHPTEPCSLVHQAMLEDMVQRIVQKQLAGCEEDPQ